MKSEYLKSFYSGNVYLDFLHPRNIPKTPPVLLPESLNPFVKDRVRIFASLGYNNPCQNIKFFSAWNMLQTAHSEGKLQNIHTIVASSSGNFVAALAMLSRHFGVERVTPIVPGDTPSSKLEILRLAKARAEAVDYPMQRAKELESQEGVLHLNQYKDLSNPEGYEKYYAPSIFSHAKGEVNVLCCGIGTGGTLMGVSKYLKARTNATVVGVRVAPDEAVPGVRTEKRLKEVELKWQDHIDGDPVDIGARESFRKSLQMYRLAGIVGGPSSGFALAGLLKFLTEAKNKNELDRYRSKQGTITAVFCCPDTLFAYLDKYTTHLDSTDF